jgi:hypothetical protein
MTDEGGGRHWAAEAGREDSATLKEWLKQPDSTPLGQTARQAVYDRDLQPVWKGIVDAARDAVDAYNQAIGYEALKCDTMGRDDVNLTRRSPPHEIQIHLDRRDHTVWAKFTNRENWPEKRTWRLRIADDELVIVAAAERVSPDELVRSIFDALRELRSVSS